MMEPRDLDLTGGQDAGLHSGPVICLGLEFVNDEARRAHFTEELRKKLQDPEFRKIEGFPIGSDEDILNLSDPPYYTACPNPWTADFIAEWEAQKPDQPVDVAAFEKEAKRILKEVEKECGWMYETLHTDGKTKGKINYTVWSETFNCPHCGKEVIYFEAAVDKETSAVNKDFKCPSCAAELDKGK